MTDLERRALMGDKEAQRECTEKCILLPCPFCAGDGTLHTTDCCETVYAVCTKCGTVTKPYPTSNKAIEMWNTRPAPPVGVCSICKYFKIRGSSDEIGYCDKFDFTTYKDNCCSHFEMGCDE